MKYILTLFLCLFITTEANCAIRALGGSEYNAKKSHSTTQKHSSDNIDTKPIANLKGKNTTLVCNKNGFTLKKCPAGYAPVLPCPENNKLFKDCCPQDYRYNANTCIERGLEPSSETCLGFHACRPPKEKENQPDNKKKAT